MDEIEKQNKIFQKQYEQMSRNSQYRVTAIPLHLHNEADAPPIPAQNLSFTNFMIWGQVALSSGSAAIQNPNILETSVILVTSTVSYSGTTLRGNCSNGTASIEGGLNTETVNFLIIF